jgi:dinuclear metal center YbgI/SA1388 family protein
MNLHELDIWCRSFLEIDALSDIDDSLNGIQVGRSDGTIRKVAFAVDACAETIRRAAENSADVLFVHHGMLWGKRERIDGSMLERVRALLSSNTALYACHLPLDKNAEVGNNAVLASLLGLTNRTPFGFHHGVPIGISGSLEKPLSIHEIVSRILPDGSAPRALMAAGKDKIGTVAIVSGGAPFEVLEAIRKDLDLYVTGEPSHSIYHTIVENGINFIAAGHYATEIWGVKAVAAKLSRETDVETLFLDLPTGL